MPLRQIAFRRGSGFCVSSRLHSPQEEDNRTGRDREADQEQVFREMKEPAHPGYKPDAPSAADEDVTGNVEQNSDDEEAMAKLNRNPE